MYCVEIVKYHRGASVGLDHRVTFETREEAMDYVKSLKDYNVGIWLTGYELDENGNWLEGLPICLQEIDYNG